MFDVVGDDNSVVFVGYRQKDKVIHVVREQGILNGGSSDHSGHFHEGHKPERRNVRDTFHHVFPRENINVFMEYVYRTDDIESTLQGTSDNASAHPHSRDRRGFSL